MCGIGCPFGWDNEEKGDRDQCFRARLGRPACVRSLRGQIGKLSVSAISRLATPSVRHAGTTDARRFFAPPTLETVIVPPPSRRQKHASCCAHPACGTRPADQPTRRTTFAKSCSSRSTVRCRKRLSRQRWRLTLPRRYDFRETTTICIERPIGAGRPLSSYSARRLTRLSPPSDCASSQQPVNTGVEFRREVRARIASAFCSIRPSRRP